MTRPIIFDFDAGLALRTATRREVAGGGRVAASYLEIAEIVARFDAD